LKCFVISFLAEKSIDFLFKDEFFRFKKNFSQKAKKFSKKS